MKKTQPKKAAKKATSRKRASQQMESQRPIAIKAPDPEQVLQLAARHEILQGTYCNMAVLRHTDTEFLFDFVMKEGSEGHLVAKVITNPKHAKRFLRALQDNISKYEAKNGVIEIE